MRPSLILAIVVAALISSLASSPAVPAAQSHHRRAAPDFRGIRIGSPLSQVRSAWPNGKLLWGLEESRTFATFLTGTRVVFRFSPEDIPSVAFKRPAEKVDVDMRIRVQKVEVWPHPAPLPERCVPGYCL